ncbi:hypothetical protein E2C01_032533 [Portunus trituberculatus]|uniref:Uncharacterized protein n=1 Tax=Portunus trituberculatus TaxID=210409 RepID=A0A5B7EZV8_PORTR|nr:hypothetical protein [Portunus trituberculatus]
MTSINDNRHTYTTFVGPMNMNQTLSGKDTHYLPPVRQEEQLKRPLLLPPSRRQDRRQGTV